MSIVFPVNGAEATLEKQAVRGQKDRGNTSKT